jgi:Zn-dependent protease with chaperone function
MNPAADTVDAQLFDGRHAQGQRVSLRLSGDELQAAAQGDLLPDAQSVRRWPLRDVQWPERTRHPRRTIHLADGCSLQVDDGAAFDAWAAANGRGDSWVVRAQQSWKHTLVALLALVQVGAAGYQWGLPWAAERAAYATPAAVESLIGERTLAFLDERWFQPSEVPPEKRQALTQAFARALSQAGEPMVPPPEWRLEFRKGSEALGPNALALPGGVIVLTDEIVALLSDRQDALVGVIAHEYGHVRLRHGLRSVMQAGALAGVFSLALGDAGTILATAPVLLAQMDYSRQFERQADEEAVRILRGAGLPPDALVVFFERIAPQEAKGEGRKNPLGIALGSHPHPAERIEAFRRAAQTP